MALNVFGVDYAWSKPSPDTLKRAGAKYAMRYLSHDASKNLTRAERDSLWARGIRVGVVWETVANRAMSGRSGGAEDARSADAQAKALGLDGIPIYFAVDWDVTPAQKPTVRSYLDGAASVIGRARVGVYGGYYVIDYMADHQAAAWFWQTYAWSGGQVHPKLHIYQYKNGVSLGGGNADFNRATNSPAGYGARLKPGHASTGHAAGASEKTKARWRSNVAVLTRIIAAHAGGTSKWPKATLDGLRKARDRYRKALGR
jgi:Rv2525c-like, glycoside hydrolase-like domain